MTKKSVLWGVLFGLLLSASSAVFAGSCDILWKDQKLKGGEYLQNLKQYSVLKKGATGSDFPVVNLGAMLRQVANSPRDPSKPNGPRSCPERVAGLTDAQLADRFLKANGKSEGLGAFPSRRMPWSDLQSDFIARQPGAKTGLPKAADVAKEKAEFQKSSLRQLQQEVIYLKRRVSGTATETDLASAERRIQRLITQEGGDRKKAFAAIKKDLDAAKSLGADVSALKRSLTKIQNGEIPAAMWVKLQNSFASQANMVQATAFAKQSKGMAREATAEVDYLKWLLAAVALVVLVFTISQIFQNRKVRKHQIALSGDPKDPVREIGLVKQVEKLQSNEVTRKEDAELERLLFEERLEGIERDLGHLKDRADNDSQRIVAAEVEVRQLAEQVTGVSFDPKELVAAGQRALQTGEAQLFTVERADSDEQLPLKLERAADVLIQVRGIVRRPDGKNKEIEPVSVNNLPRVVGSAGKDGRIVGYKEESGLSLAAGH